MWLGGTLKKSILGAMTGSRFVGITPWPGDEREKAYIVL